MFDATGFKLPDNVTVLPPSEGPEGPRRMVVNIEITTREIRHARFGAVLFWLVLGFLVGATFMH